MQNIAKIMFLTRQNTVPHLSLRLAVLQFFSRLDLETLTLVRLDLTLWTDGLEIL